MKTALVTGAASGIGRAVAARLLADGWRVVMADRDPACRPLGPGSSVVIVDVGDEEDVARLVGGLDRLDALVSNAGINVRKPLEQLTLAEWNRVLATNLTSTFLLARAGAEKLRAARGSIVTIASTRAHQSEPETEAYAASKGGVVALTHALAVSLGPQVRVNCISPGWIDTKSTQHSAADHAQHPAGRVGVPADIAGLVAYLVGPESGFITGAEFVVDGGMTRKMIYEP